MARRATIAALWLTATIVSVAATARSQEAADLCGGPLPYQSSPAVDQRFRLQCTVQKLIAERADAENRATAASVQAAVEAGHARAQSDSLDATNAKLKWWEDCGAHEECLAWLMPHKAAKFDWFGFWKR